MERPETFEDLKEIQDEGADPEEKVSRNSESKDEKLDEEIEELVSMTGISIGEDIGAGGEEEGLPDIFSGESGSGIVLETAEELYVREKTFDIIEENIRPPFRRNFSHINRVRLDIQASQRAEGFIRRSSPELSFIPAGIYEDSEMPVSTAKALAVQTILLLPVINLIAAVWLAFFAKTNRNLIAYSRAFLIISSFFALAIMTALAFFFFSTPETAARLTMAANCLIN